MPHLHLKISKCLKFVQYIEQRKGGTNIRFKMIRCADPKNSPLGGGVGGRGGSI